MGHSACFAHTLKLHEVNGVARTRVRIMTVQTGHSLLGHKLNTFGATVYCHGAVSFEPIHPQNFIICAQGQNLLIRAELTALSSPCALRHLCSAEKLTSICHANSAGTGQLLRARNRLGELLVDE